MLGQSRRRKGKVRRTLGEYSTWLDEDKVRQDPHTVASPRIATAPGAGVDRFRAARTARHIADAKAPHRRRQAQSTWPRLSGRRAPDSNSFHAEQRPLCGLGRDSEGALGEAIQHHAREPPITAEPHGDLKEP